MNGLAMYTACEALGLAASAPLSMLTVHHHCQSLQLLLAATANGDCESLPPLINND
jgi:hypothetical protein